MRNLKVLAVDDSKAALSFLKKGLKMAGLDVETAGSGVEAVDLISNSHFDVVVTDLIMPGGMDGISVLEAVKTRSARTEVIIMTSQASVNTAVAAMKKGAADYLEKPVNIDELVLRLHKISELKSLIEHAGDLREAMDATETHAAESIHNLELKVLHLQRRLSEINKVLCDVDIGARDRVMKALEVLSSPLPP